MALAQEVAGFLRERGDRGFRIEGQTYEELEGLCGCGVPKPEYDLLLNATSVGMYPHAGFQTFDNDKFENGNVFSAAFINSFLRSLKRNTLSPELEDAIKNILHSTDYTDKYFSLKELFEQLSDLCAAAEKKIVLMIDEVDSASNNQVFLDFLAQLRAQYIERDIQPTFRAVILAGAI